MKVSIVVDIQTISIAIASTGVFLAAIYYILQLRHQKKMRQTDLLVRIAPWLNMSSIELQQAVIKTLNTEYKDYDDFLKKYGKLHSDKPEQTAILAVLNYLEGIGILVRRKLVDIDLVYDFWSGDITTLWEKLKPIVEGEKRKWNYPLLLNSEYLYNEVKKREQKLQQTGVKSG
jgi:hypothetical protein